MQTLKLVKILFHLIDYCTSRRKGHFRGGEVELRDSLCGRELSKTLTLFSARKHKRVNTELCSMTEKSDFFFFLFSVRLTENTNREKVILVNAKGVNPKLCSVTENVMLLFSSFFFRLGSQRAKNPSE